LGYFFCLAHSFKQKRQIAPTSGHKHGYAELCLAIKHARHEAGKRPGFLCPDVGAISKEDRNSQGKHVTPASHG